MSMHDTTVAGLTAIRARAQVAAGLEAGFFPTRDHALIRDRIFAVLEERDVRLAQGFHEQKGAALIGPAGSGKSRIIAEVLREYRAVAATSGGREFGTEVVSVIVPARASIKDTASEILRTLGYPIRSGRNEDALFQRIGHHLRERKVAGLHLDEVQDSGRFKTIDSREVFAKRFRNLMQDPIWPVCLILSATTDAAAFVNHDPTLTRRLRPVEMQPATLEVDGDVLKGALRWLLDRARVEDAGLCADDDFLEVLLHAAARCFGLAIEISIAAISEAVSEGAGMVTIEHFADVWHVRTNSDDACNPFVEEDWRRVDTRIAMARMEDFGRAGRPRRH